MHCSCSGDERQTAQGHLVDDVSASDTGAVQAVDSFTSTADDEDDNEEATKLTSRLPGVNRRDSDDEPPPRTNNQRPSPQGATIALRNMRQQSNNIGNSNQAGNNSQGKRRQIRQVATVPKEVSAHRQVPKQRKQVIVIKMAFVYLSHRHNATANSSGTTPYPHSLSYHNPHTVVAGTEALGSIKEEDDEDVMTDTEKRQDASSLEVTRTTTTNNGQ